MKLTFRPISAGMIGDIFGAEWPEWVRALDGKSGVYFIRSLATKQILYVGESHSGNLKKTFLRHFQAWSGRTAGKTYLRGDVDAAAIVTPPARAVAFQNSQILKLEPRDNTVSPKGEIHADENPF
jgi:hypothetical protein